MAAPGLLSVGRITKPHGLKGDLLLVLTTNRTERAAVGSVLHTSSGRILTIVFSAVHQDRWRVRFEGVTDRNGADLLHGTEVFAEPIDDPDALWIHELIGARVTLTDGTEVGTVGVVESAGASDLLVLTDGRMIPLVFVVTHTRADDGSFVVTIDPPAGLLDDTESV